MILRSRRDMDGRWARNASSGDYQLKMAELSSHYFLVHLRRNWKHPLLVLFILACCCGPSRDGRGQETLEQNFFVLESQAVAAAVARVSDAVVQIEVIGVSETPGGEVASDAPTAGTVIDPSGLILASRMVTERPAASILVVLGDGTRLPAEVIAEDEGREIVLLKVVPKKPLPAIDWTPARDVRVGQYAIAVGRIRNDGPASRSVGIVSALSRLEGRALQTDARISPPFYGGPLVNIRGELLGIVVPAMPSSGGGGDKTGWYDSGIAFVAPADQIATRLETLKSGTSIRPGKLGIVAGESDPLADGTTISAVRVGSPAAEVDMRPGDVVQSINGVTVTRHQQIKEILGPLDAGTQVSVEVVRDGESRTMTPTLVAEIPPFDPQSIGLLIDPDSQPPRVSGVFESSPALRGDVRLGDQIIEFDGTVIPSAEELRRRVLTSRSGREIPVVVLRDDQRVELKVTPASVAGAWPESIATLPGEVAGDSWKTTDVTLPDVANKAAMLAPSEDTEGVVGILVAFAKPGTEKLDEWLAGWKEVAVKRRVIVAVLGATDPQRWSPEEAELASRLVAIINKRYRVQPHAVAVTGEGPGATLAMIVAFADPATFAGVTIASDVRPPAIQLRENDPTKPLVVHLQRAGENLPPWTPVMKQAGYAVVDSLPGKDAVLQFVWSLGRI